MKRWISVILAIMILLGGVPNLAAAGSPQQQDHTIAGSVLATSKKLNQTLTSGEWEYYLDGNEAVICGYRNPAETELKLPYLLDGHPVTGLAEDAFTAQTGLKRLTVHSYVTKIADHLFAEGSKPSIAANAGAYALKYAKRHSVNRVNLTNNGNSVHIFSENLIDFSGFSSKDYEINGQKSITVSKAIAGLLKTGGIIYIPSESSGSDIYAGKITAIENLGEKARIQLETPDSLGEVLTGTEFKDADLSLDQAQIRCYDGVEVVGESPNGSSTYSGSGSAKKELKMEKKLPGGLVLKGKLAFGITGNVAAKIHYGLKWDWIPIDVGLDYIEIGLTPSFSANVKLEVQSKYREQVAKLADISFNTPIPGLVIGITLKAKLNVSGTIEFFYELKDTFKVRYENGKLNITNNISKKGPDINANAEVKFTLPLEVNGNLAVTLLGYKLGLKLLSFGVDPGLKMTAKAEHLLSDPYPCAEINVYFVFGVSGEIGLISILYGKKEKDLHWSGKLSKSWDVPLIAPIHFDKGENGFKYVPHCRSKGRQAVFKFGNGQKDYTVKVNAGDKVKAPAQPRRSGYVFTGWQLDTKASGLYSIYKTDKVNWDFNSKLRYINDDTSRYTFVAKWNALDVPVPPGPPTTDPPTTEPPVTVPPVTPPPGGPTNPPPTEVPEIKVQSVSLNKTSVELQSVAGKNTVQLKATVSPSNADNKEVRWETSKSSVAYVDYTGKVTAMGPGEAVITCTSVGNPKAKATCKITVKQPVIAIYLTGDKDLLLPNETLQLKAQVAPDNASNKKIAWSSSNPAAATVSDSGLVKAVGYGEANIIAAAKDGSGVQSTFKVTVEKELALIVDTVYPHLYKQGEAGTTFAYVRMSPASAERMAKLGYTPQWSLTGNEDNGIFMSEISSEQIVSGVPYDARFVSLQNTENGKTGNKTYTVTCKAGQYTESVTVPLELRGEEYAGSVKLDSTTLKGKIDEAVLIPLKPKAADGKKIPDGLTVNLEGDEFLLGNMTTKQTDKNLEVTFSKSAVYSGTAVYHEANLQYEIPLTFRIADKSGVVHIPISEITLNKLTADMVTGETLELKASVSPSDAYNKTLNWRSSDEKIATVSKEGKVKAVSQGTATIYCEATDGSRAVNTCVVKVEPFMALGDKKIQLTVGMDGDTHVLLDSCFLTFESSQRLQKAKLRPTWNLEKKSGDSVDIGLKELEGNAGSEILVYGASVELLRMYKPGTSTYQLTCTAGSEKASCTVTIDVVKSLNLPQSVTARKALYEAKIGDEILLDLGYNTVPAGGTLPAGTVITLERSIRFDNALNENYRFNEEKLVFDKAGEYDATLILQGTNYSYKCPVKFRIADKSGQVPQRISEILISPDTVRLEVGKAKDLTVSVKPEGVQAQGLKWTSLDTSVATVSAAGHVTGVSAGRTVIQVTTDDSDEVGVCAVFVEDGITFDGENIETTVFLDGDVRKAIETVYLTESSSARLKEAPNWQLVRKSGKSLTLRANPTERLNKEGDPVYGCDLILYSVSKTGTCEYELICTNGNQKITRKVTVTAKERGDTVPAAVTLKTTDFTGKPGELISVQPEIVCMPKGTKLAGGTRVVLNFAGVSQRAVNQKDLFVSQGLTTVSFNAPGRYEAAFVYTLSNLTYTVPVTFSIQDQNGKVPVHPSSMKLSAGSLHMVKGDQKKLEAIFTPVDTSNQKVTWESTNTSVAKVDGNGNVQAVANGTAIIRCYPADTSLETAECAVTVENFLTVETGNTSSLQYKQGSTDQVIGYAMLSEGTRERLAANRLSGEWKITPKGSSHARVNGTATEDGTRFSVYASEFLSAGTEKYTVSYTAGKYTWSKEFTLQVEDLGKTAPTGLTLKKTSVTASVNKPVTIDFTPVVKPSGAKIPSNMMIRYVGLGDFYDAIDYDAFEPQLRKDKVKITFKKKGTYVLCRRYILRNLQFVTSCVISVDDKAGKTALLEATDTEYTIYQGGESGIASTVSLTDSAVSTLYENDIDWSISRVSGSSVTAAVRKNGASADVFVASIEKNGTDVWRVTCSFGNVKESVDISITAAAPGDPLPKSVKLVQDHVDGTIGDMQYVPLGFECSPKGSALPDRGDSFWSFEMDGYGSDMSSWDISDGMLKISFVQSGFYTGTVTYRSGNVSFSEPVYFTIRDEEDEIHKPALKAYLLNAMKTVYPEGDTKVSIGQVMIAEGLSAYSTGAAAAYIKQFGADWSVSIDKGSAASLSLKKVTENVYDIILSKINGTGDISYTVTCKAKNMTMNCSGKLHVAAKGEKRPVAKLARSTYSGTVGKTLSIDRTIYNKANDAVLQSSTVWDASALLAAVGYEVKEKDNRWEVTLYKAGTFKTKVIAYVGNIKVELPLTVKAVKKEKEEKLPELKIPAAMKAIEEEAFMGASVSVVDLRKTKVTKIGSRAFAKCIELVKVYIPETVTDIHPRAFEDSLNVTIYCYEGSYADRYAQEHSIPVNYL